MPTGYTYGIIDGSVKTFNEFATNCIKAFGAALHMREDPADKKYEPRTPSDYHKKAIDEANAELKKAKDLSDKEILSLNKSKLEKDLKYHLDKISKINKNNITLRKFLSDAEMYVPPTKEHIGIKEFMIQQLTDTIKYDGSTEYHDIKILGIRKQLKEMNVTEIRNEMMQTVSDNIKYHTKEYKEEVKCCNDANKWAEDYLNSIK